MELKRKYLSDFLFVTKWFKNNLDTKYVDNLHGNKGNSSDKYEWTDRHDTGPKLQGS